jgi:hypothetical protein
MMPAGRTDPSTADAVVQDYGTCYRLTGDLPQPSSTCIQKTYVLVKILMCIIKLVFWIRQARA